MKNSNQFAKHELEHLVRGIVDQVISQKVSSMEANIKRVLNLEIQKMSSDLMRYYKASITGKIVENYRDPLGLFSSVTTPQKFTLSNKDFARFISKLVFKYF